MIPESADAGCLVRARAGDAAAFAELVRRYAATAKRAAVLWGAGSEADDVVQESFVRAYGALGRFRIGEPFRPWLLRIVVNETRNLHRSRARRSRREERWAWPPALPVDPAAEATNATRRDALLAAVGSLPVDLREVVTCRYLLELSEAETATALRVPPGTVKSRLHRALGRLREEVPDDRP